MVEGIRGNLGAEKIENRENPMDTKGVSRSVCIPVVSPVQSLLLQLISIPVFLWLFLLNLCT